MSEPASGHLAAGARVRLRPVDVDRPADVEAVLALNHDHVEMLAPMDAARLVALAGWADRFDVIEVDGVAAAAGFVLTIAPGTGYGSPNYRWFADVYGKAFYYLDRIVVAPRLRRAGVAAAVYDAVEDVARRYRRMVLEVSIDPPNHASLAFHAARGYGPVHCLGEPGHRVSLMCLELES